MGEEHDTELLFARSPIPLVVPRFLAYDLGINLNIVVAQTAQLHRNARLEHNLRSAGKDVERHDALRLDALLAYEHLRCLCRRV